MKASLGSIKSFLAPKKFAIAGASRDPKKFGHAVFKELSEIGYDIYPVNPNADVILEKKCYKSIKDLPADVTNLFIVTSKTRTNEILKEAAAKGIKNIWIQQGSHTKESFEIAKENGVNLIAKQCIFMFAKPEGIHKFHAALKKFLGRYPK